MKHWKISESDGKHKYLIPTEKAIWLTEQSKNADIDELIRTRNLRAIQSIRYEELKEIIFIDSEYTIDFISKDDKDLGERYEVDKTTYHEIKTYLKNQLKGIALKNYSVFEQIVPQLVTLGFAIILSIVTYVTAIELEKGESLRTSGRKAFLKKIIVGVADGLGTAGTVIVGIIIISAILYLIIKKIQNPLKGEILRMTKYPKLTV